jgi:hypothetical protein
MSRHALPRTIWQRFVHHRTRLAAVGLALGLAGCAGGVALNRSFNDYTAVHADITNRQLLLNLARMANTHPPHFLQLGLINSTFQFGATATAQTGGSRTDGRSAAGAMQLLQRATTWGATATATVTEQPTFAFTPLSGPQFAQGFLGIVSPTVFFSLLEQGEPIDQLMRILVQSIEYTEETTDRTPGRRVILVNSLTTDNPEPWIQFVRLVGIAAELQRRHLIRVSVTPTSTPVPGSPLFENPPLDHVVKLAEKGLTLVPAPGQPNKFVIAAPATVSALEVLPEAREVWIRELSKQPQFQISPPNPLEPARRQPASPFPPNLGGVTLKLRSFFEMLTWLSREQAAFDALAATDPGFVRDLPPSQQQPVLRLTWDAVKDEVEPPLVAVDYGGQVYAITDTRASATWNRDVFTLLSYIHSQVSLDPSKLPVQQLIQIR